MVHEIYDAVRTLYENPVVQEQGSRFVVGGVLGLTVGFLDAATGYSGVDTFRKRLGDAVLATAAAEVVSEFVEYTDLTHGVYEEELLPYDTYIPFGAGYMVGKYIADSCTHTPAKTYKAVRKTYKKR